MSPAPVMVSPLKFFRDRRAVCVFLFILALCLMLISLQYYLLLGDVVIELIISQVATPRHVTITQESPTNHASIMMGATNSSSSGLVTIDGDEGRLPVTITQNHYKFVAFKKKPGWHFVKFPCNYQCKDHGVSVSVHLTDNPVDVANADAVFFSTGPFTLEEWQDLQHYRKPGQVWVFATQEPASIVPDFLPPKVYRYNSFNWSFTFHSNSDIHGAYGWYHPTPEAKHSKSNRNWHAEKPKMAAWVSTRHCGGLGWDRTKFVEDLGKFIKVDMYGGCGNLTIGRNAVITKAIFIKYKFHLGLENSCCSEYLTEKVWNALQRFESVPIVLGGTKEEYRRLMPPHSYIHADDFDSMEDLARYIKTVSESETLYNEYHAWRNIGSTWQQGFNFRFPVFREGACKVAGEMRAALRESPIRRAVFDPYGPDWFGSCYRCGNHGWIQDYNFWWRRTIFAQNWEDNRTLHWLDGHDIQPVYN